MSDVEIQRMVDFLVKSARERVDDDAPIAPESMDAIREAARGAHAAWKARSEKEVPIALGALNVGDVNVDIDETFDMDDLDEIFSRRDVANVVEDEKRRESDWRRKASERAERAADRRKSAQSTRLVLALIIFVVGVGIAYAVRGHFEKEHEKNDDKSEMKH